MEARIEDIVRLLSRPDFVDALKVIRSKKTFEASGTVDLLAALLSLREAEGILGVEKTKPLSSAFNEDPALATKGLLQLIDEKAFAIINIIHTKLGIISQRELIVVQRLVEEAVLKVVTLSDEIKGAL